MNSMKLKAHRTKNLLSLKLPQSFVYVFHSGITDALFELVKLLLSPRLVLPSLVGDRSNGA